MLEGYNNFATRKWRWPGFKWITGWLLLFGAINTRAETASVKTLIHTTSFYCSIFCLISAECSSGVLVRQLSPYYRNVASCTITRHHCSLDRCQYFHTCLTEDFRYKNLNAAVWRLTICTLLKIRCAPSLKLTLQESTEREIPHCGRHGSTRLFSRWIQSGRSYSSLQHASRLLPPVDGCITVKQGGGRRHDARTKPQSVPHKLARSI